MEINVIEKFSVPALQQWQLRPLEIDCLHPWGCQTELQLSLDQELPAPQSLADPCQPSQAPLTPASASDKRDGPTALTRPL